MAKLIAIIQYILISILIVLLVIFSWFFIESYDLPYNSEGCYFDEATATVYHQQAVEIYGIISIILFVLAFVTLIWIIKKKRINITFKHEK